MTKKKVLQARCLIAKKCGIFQNKCRPHKRKNTQTSIIYARAAPETSGICYKKVYNRKLRFSLERNLRS
jgi:hypothetical protein